MKIVRIKHLLLICLFVLMNPNAYADDWVSTHSLPSHRIYIHRVHDIDNGNQVSFWVKHVFPKNAGSVNPGWKEMELKYKKAIAYMIVRQTIDCTTHKSAVDEFTYYGWHNEPLQVFETPYAGWNYITPDSWMDDYVKMLCPPGY